MGRGLTAGGVVGVESVDDMLAIEAVRPELMVPRRMGDRGRTVMGANGLPLSTDSLRATIFQSILKTHFFFLSTKH